MLYMMPADTAITMRSAVIRNRWEVSMNWTKSQSEAIESKAKTLLVSAGAGSGKTTVLTHRLAKRIIAGDSVDDFLVVTFTRAAAGDLRDKLYNALSDALAEQPLNRHLINQLYLLPGARISTIHSFCYDLIKKNFAVLGLSPRMRITDETESAMIARICMEELVDSFYQKGDREFLLLVDNFGGEKSDDALIEKLLSLYNRIRAFHNYREWFEERQEQLVKQAQLVKGGFFDSIYGDKIRLNILFRLGEAKTATEDLLLFLSNNGDSEGNIVPIETLDSYIDTLINATNTSYDTLLSAFSSNKRIPSLKIKGMPEEYGKYLTEEKKRIIGEIKSIKKSFCYLTEQDIYEDFISTIEIGDALKKTIFLFDTLFSDTKKNKAVLAFADLEHYLAQLLEEKDSDGQPAPTALCLRLQRKFKEIYIDEYQDINPLQDHIFRLLSSDKKDVSGSGRFLVGDIKQSIYRFRNAYPDIFVGYKESFPD
ncbi:MAG TPA: hypothetical protein DD733_00695, partial [Clostridiales bacterium]|nr:hypothetical protein [Clostridiales bacterium]